MIKGVVINPRSNIIKNELNYRALSALNCSMIKLYDSDPIKFFEEFKLGKKRKDRKNVSLYIGDIVDFYILDCNGDEEIFESRFDEKFKLYEGVKGTKQVYSLCDKVYEIRQQYANDQGVITVEFDIFFKEAYDNIKEQGLYKSKDYDKVLEDFNKNGKDYFKYLIDNSDKVIVDYSIVNKAKKVAKSVIDDEFCKDLFIETDTIEHFTKFPIQWNFKTSDGQVLQCKSELDLFIIDHLKKEIYPKDLKTNYDNENFEFSYLKYRYDLQAAFYYLALKEWAKENELGDYKILPMEFIVADTSSNNRRPIRYKTTERDLEAGLNGYNLNRVRYNGIYDIVNSICWSDQNDIWNISKEVFENKGIMKLNLEYE
jgi:hypothetical protein